MSNLSKAERDKLPEADFGDPERRLFVVVDQADLDAAAKLIGRAKNPPAVKKRLAAIAKRKSLKIPEAWAAEFAAEEERERDYVTVEFALAAEGEIKDGYVTRTAPVLFRAGDYPDKQFAMSPEELALAADDFRPVPIKVEHIDTVFDRKLGDFTGVSLSDDLQTLGGKAKLPKWLDDLLGADERKLSASWHRPTKRLKEVSLVRNPRVTGAALEAAFAAADRDNRLAAAYADADAADLAAKTFTPHGRQALQEVHDLAAQKGARCDGDSAAFTTSEEGRHLQAIHDAAKKGGAACRVYSDKGMASMSTDPAVLQLQKDLEEERKKRKEEARKRIDAEAAAFAQAEISANRALPANRADLAAEYTQAALDDEAHPDTAAFGGKSRVAALRERSAARVPHALTQEQVKAGETVVLSGGGGGGAGTEEEQAKRQAEAYAAERNKHTANGRR